MNLRKTLHNNKGYTLIELMITLFIFAIITMFGVPAFYDFIEQSRAKSQMIKAANFLRSAQEIATSTNRIVYVYTTGYFDYETKNLNDDSNDLDAIKRYRNYWYEDWVMSFKPIGHTHTTIAEQDASLRIGAEGNRTANPNYLIAQQTIFTKSNQYYVNVLDSSKHNAIDRKKIGSSNGEMEGYSRVRQTPDQGVVEGKPTYLVFYPSGAVVMPVFLLTEQRLSNTDFFTDLPTKINSAIGVLAGCRTSGRLTIDEINYSFNQAIIQNALTFTATALAGTSGSPPSFSQNICGSRFLQ